MLRDDIQIVVLGTTKRPIITNTYITDDHITYYNQDWPPIPFTPPDPVAKFAAVHEPGPFRCFRGHQEALKLSNKQYTLMFEDDAIPNTTNWQQIVNDSCELLDTYDIVSLHARSAEGIDKRFLHKGREYMTLKPTKYGHCWALAALAYLVHRRAIDQLVNVQYNGIPWDIFIYDHNTCILEVSPFDHDRRGGSLIEHKSTNLGIQRANGQPPTPPKPKPVPKPRILHVRSTTTPIKQSRPIKPNTIYTSPKPMSNQTRILKTPKLPAQVTKKPISIHSRTHQRPKSI